MSTKSIKACRNVAAGTALALMLVVFTNPAEEVGASALAGSDAAVSKEFVHDNDQKHSLQTMLFLHRQGIIGAPVGGADK
ncbi:MAG: hypothetical protein J0M28_14110 [Thauera sp.]|nr:hypothetical protein [Thauera sp.]